MANWVQSTDNRKGIWSIPGDQWLVDGEPSGEGRGESININSWG